MEAYANHLNKIKIPEIDSQLTTLEGAAPTSVGGEFSIPQPADSILNPAQPVEERVQIKQPNPGELMVERVITQHAPISSSPHGEYEADISTEEDEALADEHGSHGQRRVSGAKKLKQKLSKALHKVFHKGDSKKEEELVQHHVPPETGNPDDASNQVTLHKEVSSGSHDQHVQDRLESAFATEGLKASRDPTDGHTTANRFEAPNVTPAQPLPTTTVDLGRMMDLQDHRAPHLQHLPTAECPPPTEGYSVHRALESGPVKVTYSVRRAEMAGDPVLADLNEGSLSPLRRGSASGGRPHVPVYSSPEPVHFDNVEVRSHVGGEGHLTRSAEIWNLPAKTEEEQQRRSPLQAMEKEAEKFSANFVRVGEHQHAQGDTYEHRLEMAREKWVNPIVAGATAHHGNEHVHGIPSDKSISSFQASHVMSDVPMRPFERVESDTDVLREGYRILTEKIRVSADKPREHSNADPLDEVSHMARQFVAARDEIPKGDNMETSHNFPATPGLNRDEFSNQKGDVTAAPPKKLLGKEDSGTAPDESIVHALANMTPLQRDERIVDMETAGNDLAPKHRDYQVTSTIPGSLDQPVLELPSKPIPELPRETDRSLDRSDTVVDESHTEADEKSLVSTVVESVESVVSAVGSVVGSAVTGIFHHRDTADAPPPDPDHPQRTGIMDKVAEKVWEVFTAGTGGPEVPDLPTEAEKVPEVVQETVEPLAVSGEFVAAPVKAVEAGLSGGQQRRQTASRDI